MNQLVDEIYSKNEIDFNFSFKLADICAKSLRNENEKNGREVIIAIIDNWNKVEDNTKCIWLDLVNASGFYPYLELLQSENPQNTAQLIKKYYHQSDNIENIIFHEEQKELLSSIYKGTNLVVSAPTSFGKSLLIEEIVASNKYNNIVIIQPTLALINETFLKLRKYKKIYNIIIKTNQVLKQGSKNIFLFTAERVMEYENLPKIDFVVMDEFYKLSAKRDDERSDVLNNAANLLLNKHKAQFYFLGPNIHKIADGFAEKYDAEFYKTDYSLVNNKIIDLYSQNIKSLNSPGKTKFKEELLFNLLIELKDTQTIIYCSSPERAQKLGNKFLKYILENKILLKPRNLELMDWINENISPKWNFIKLLNQGIGVHNGALLKHINDSIIEYFNENNLNYLFCTSTIIEGVNTTAKNVVIFDEKKGGNPIDFFDFNNIKGRSGRMMKHFLGNVFLFNPTPDDEEIVIDIPFYDQINITDEVLINLDKSSIKKENIDQYDLFSTKLKNYFEVVRKNNISIQGQLNIIQELEKEIDQNPQNVIWNGIPKYEQLESIINLGWKNLLKDGETTTPMTAKKLLYVTNKFGKKSGFKEALRSEYSFQSNAKNNKNKSSEEILDLSIIRVMQVQRHWLRYKVPKWLNVINNLQKEICLSKGITPGNYSAYASLLENDFVRANLSLLIDLGVPSSAVFKIENYIPREIEVDNVLNYINEKRLDNLLNLSSYEQIKIRKLLNNN